jgi:hypothetical protein
MAQKKTRACIEAKMVKRVEITGVKKKIAGT